MTIDTEDSGFLSRWSRRKALDRRGVEVTNEAAAAEGAPQTKAIAQPAPSLPVLAEDQATNSIESRSAPTAQEATSDRAPAATLAQEAPLLTLDDVAALTKDSDYSRFLKLDVQPDVKNAALSKLFTDPHFNVMDGLDVYIDDYGKPDPLPEGMLRKMVQAHVLGLFDHEKDQTTGPESPELPDPLPNSDVPVGVELADAAKLTDDAVAADTEESPPPGEAEHTPELTADENTDLQLQPDDGGGRQSTATGAEQDPGRIA